MRLICFGDSWTAGHGVEENPKYLNIANPIDGGGFITNLRKFNSWPRYLSDKFDCPFVNNGVCGYGNLDILNEVIKIEDDKLFNQDDVIIVMFSYPHRYRIKKPKNDPVYVINELEKILKNRTHFYFNSFYPTFKDEQNFDISTLPQCFLEPNYCISDFLKKYEMDNGVSIWENGKRLVWNDNKNFNEGIYHPNITGYKLIANYIYDKIKNLI